MPLAVLEPDEERAGRRPLPGRRVDRRGDEGGDDRDGHGRHDVVTIALDRAALRCRALLCLALPCLALPCRALPSLPLPCLALPCLALPCLALPYIALPALFCLRCFACIAFPFPFPLPLPLPLPLRCILFHSTPFHSVPLHPTTRTHARPSRRCRSR